MTPRDGRDQRIRVELRPELLGLTTPPGKAAPIRVGLRNVVVEVRPGTVTEWPLDRTGLDRNDAVAVRRAKTLVTSEPRGCGWTSRLGSRSLRS
jgi:hypothetical protein